MEELDLKELFELFWSKKLTIVILVVVFAIIGAVYSIFFVTPKYKSSTTLVLTKTESNIKKRGYSSYINRTQNK